jgi:hypothetical protein
MASMLEALGGAAKVVAAVNERIMGRNLRAVFMGYFLKAFRQIIQ